MEKTQTNMILLAVWLACDCNPRKATKWIREKRILTEEEKARAYEEKDIDNLVCILDADYPKRLLNTLKNLPLIYRKKKSKK